MKLVFFSLTRGDLEVCCLISKYVREIPSIFMLFIYNNSFWGETHTFIIYILLNLDFFYDSILVNIPCAFKRMFC